MFMVLQAALAAVSHRRLARARIFRSGSLVAGTDGGAVSDALIGCFFNIVLLRTDTSR